MEDDAANAAGLILLFIIMLGLNLVEINAYIDDDAGGGIYSLKTLEGKKVWVFIKGTGWKPQPQIEADIQEYNPIYFLKKEKKHLTVAGKNAFVTYEDGDLDEKNSINNFFKRD